MHVDVGECGDRAGLGKSCGLHPTEPFAEVVFVDAGDRAEAAGGVAVHGGIADGGFRAVAGGEEKRVSDVGHHPNARRAYAGLDVLAGNVVLLPAEGAANDGFDGVFVSFDELIDFPFGVVAADGFCHGAGGIAGDVTAILGSLIGAEEEGLHPIFGFLGEVEVRETGPEPYFAKLSEGEIKHDAGEAGDGGGVGSATERNDEATGPAFAEVVEVSQGHRASELFVF